MFNPKHLDSKVLLLLTLSRHDDHGFVPLTCDHLIQRSDRESGDTFVGQVPATSRQLVTLAYSDFFFEMLGLYGFMAIIMNEVMVFVKQLATAGPTLQGCKV